jgi:DNA helicase HerA-like ATPase
MTGKGDYAPVRRFRQNVKGVYELMKFDEFVLSIAISQLTRLSERQDTAKIANPQHRPERVIKQLENIKEHQSLKPHYERMLNQCVVLLVAYFGSALRDLFVDAASAAFKGNVSEALLKEELKVTVRQLSDMETPLPVFIAETVVEHKDISFQDMKSIRRAFETYFGVVLNRDAAMNDIIVSQACRNVLVHTDGEIDSRLIRQVSGSTPRTVKPNLVAGQRLQFTRDELTSISRAMLGLLRTIASQLAEKDLAVL